jgi:DNA ligase-1
MASPAKRRKPNKPDPAPSKTVRGLDFFFNKQKAIPTASSSQDAQNSAQTESDVKIEPADRDGEASVEAKEETDEELARRLQEEWNKVDRDVAIPQEHEEQPPAETRIPDTIVEEVKVETEASAIENKAILTNFLQPAKHTLGLQTATAAEDTISYTIPFDQSPLTFDPSKYVPQLQSQWSSEGGSATYALLTHAFVLVGSTQSRIKIVDTLVNLLRVIIEGDPSSLLPAVWLATNSISPPYIDLELGLGGSAISKALKKVCGLDNAALKTLYNKYGDAGDVAFEAKKRQSMTLRKPKPLSIKSVYESLVKIANSKGQGSVEAKQRIVERLVQDARGAEESRYIVRTLVQHVSIDLRYNTRTMPNVHNVAAYRCGEDDHAYRPISSLPVVQTNGSHLFHPKYILLNQA